MYDTIIIGAGLSGLAAGIRLAHYDKRVCILERHTTIGGLNSFYRQRGRDFDVGLHAVTNYAPQGSKRGPLARLLRQLRFRWEDFALAPQVGSSIAFPGVTLRFNNDFRLFESEVAAQFPDQKDNLRKLVDQLVDYDDLDGDLFHRSTREFLAAVDYRSAAARDDPLSDHVVRECARAGHGFRAVLHHVSQHFPRGICPPAGRRPTDPPQSRATVSQPGRRTAPAVRRRSDSD